MFCPPCGQERTSEATSFCSRCGYLLTGTAELLQTGGAPGANTPADAVSPRSRGIRQGVFMFLLMFVLAPIVGIISTFGLGIEPWPVGVVVAGLGFGGLLRIAYALMFESKYPSALPAGGVAEGQLPGRAGQAFLPPQQTYPASQFTSPQTNRRLDTEPREPSSVTDSTTRLLEKDTEPPA